MKNVLHILPLGETMREKFQKMAQKLPYGEALLLVPSPYFRQKIQEETGDTVLTAIIDYLPREILRLGGVRGFHPAKRPVQRKILKKVLEKLQPRLDYFAPLAEKDGFVESLLALMDEFSRSDISPEEFHTLLLPWNRQGRQRQKDMELDMLYFLYHQEMETLQIKDLSSQYSLAVQLLEEGLEVPWKHVFFSEFYQFSPVQLRLVKALAHKTNVEMGLFYDKRRPGLTAVTTSLYDDLIGAGFDCVQEITTQKKPEDLATFAEQWEIGSHSDTSCAHLHLEEAGSPESELHLVLQNIKEKLLSGTVPEDIVVLVRNLSDYQGLTRSFASYGLSCQLPQVTDQFGQPLPDFLTKLYAATPLKNNLDAYKALLRCPFAETAFGVDLENMEKLWCDRYFASQNAFLQYLKKQQLVNAAFWELLAFLQERHTAAAWREGLWQWITNCKLPKLWGKAYQEGRCTLRQVKAQMETLDFVERFLKEMVETWEQCKDKEELLSIKDVGSYWSEACKHAIPQTITENHDSGILVMEASALQGVSFPYVYMLGVREGIFPQIKRESWLYNDEERAQCNALGLELSVSAQSLEEDRFFFASAVAMGTKDVYLSWYRDEEGGESSYIRSLRHFYGGRLPATKQYFPNIAQCCSLPLFLNFLADKEQLDPQERNWMEQELGSDFFSRCQSSRKRWETEESRWNGEVTDLLQRPLHVSASSLDSYIGCPFAYLVSNLWKLTPWEERDPYPTPDVVGNLIHLSLAEFMSHHLGQRLENPEALWQELEKIYDSIFSAAQTKGLLAESPLLPFIKKSYGKWLHAYLVKECDYQAQSTLPFAPAKLEWSFGRAGSKWPALVKQVDGETVYISGQIDRIDCDGKKYCILDYKTGRIPSGSEISRGEAVQLPLYLEALENLGHIPQDCILGAGYVHVRSGERKGGTWDKIVKSTFPWMKSARPVEQGAALEAMQRALRIAAHGLAGGHFPSSPKGTCPSWCPGKDICRIQEKPRDLGKE